jgi:hypothetical protein
MAHLMSLLHAVSCQALRRWAVGGAAAAGSTLCTLPLQWPASATRPPTPPGAQTLAAPPAPPRSPSHPLPPTIRDADLANIVQHSSKQPAPPCDPRDLDRKSLTTQQRQVSASVGHSRWSDIFMLRSRPHHIHQ